MDANELSLSLLQSSSEIFLTSMLSEEEGSPADSEYFAQENIQSADIIPKLEDPVDPVKSCQCECFKDVFDLRPVFYGDWPNLEKIFIHPKRFV